MATTKTPASRSEWLTLRRSGIGGSDIAAILGCSKYSTPYQVWLSKTGATDEVEETWEMRIGKVMEPVIAQLWEERTECKAEANGITMHWHETEPLFCTPDYFYEQTYHIGFTHPFSALLPLSIKTSRIRIDEIPEHWFCQLQWEMGITGAPQGEIAWLEFGYDLHVRGFEFQPDFFEYMKTFACQWWSDYVMTGTPPPPIIAEDAERMYRKAVAGKSIEARKETYELVRRLSEVRTQRLNLEKEEAELSGQIKMLMRDAESLTYQDVQILTWSGEKGRTMRVKI